jgi:hypothetical protein
MNCKQTWHLAGAAASPSKSGAGRLVKVVEGGKLHRSRKACESGGGRKTDTG